MNGHSKGVQEDHSTRSLKHLGPDYSEEIRGSDFKLILTFLGLPTVLAQFRVRFGLSFH